MLHHNMPSNLLHNSISNLLHHHSMASNLPLLPISNLPLHRHSMPEQLLRTAKPQRPLLHTVTMDLRRPLLLLHNKVMGLPHPQRPLGHRHHPPTTVGNSHLPSIPQ